MTISGDLLRRAAEIVDGARNTQHGDKERSFKCVADFWTVYLEHRHAKYINTVFTRPLSAGDVAAMQVLLKLARSLHGEPIADHFVDMAGYSAILGELEAETPHEQVPNTPDFRPSRDYCDLDPHE